MRFVAALATSLDSERYRVQAWFLDEEGPLVDVLTQAGVQSRAIPFRGGRDVAGAVRMTSALLHQRPSLVHLHVGGRSRLWLLRSLSSAKLIAHLWACYAEDGTSLDLRPFSRGADAIVATSNAVAGAIADPATVIYPGVQLDEQRASLAGPLTIGSVGRLEPVKGFEYLLEAFAALSSRHKGLRLEIAGAGALDSALRGQARQLGIEHAVTFLGWRDDVKALHRRWSVYVQPSKHEGFGIAVLEAMASGLPVVATNAGGLSEVVEDERTGFLVPVGATSVLEERINLLLRDGSLRERMGRAGWRRARDQFSVDEMARRTAGVYQRLLDQ